MERFFESKPVVYMSKFIDMIMLNVIFLISCIPVFTIGAAWTAMYYTCVKVIRRDRGKVWQEYKHSFVVNFKTATGVWVILAVVEGVFAVLTFQLLVHGHGSLSAAVIGLAMAGFLFTLAMMIYAFAVLSRFTVNAKGTIQNAVLISIHHGGETVSMLVLTLGLATLIMMGWKFLPVILLIMPSAYMLLISLIMEKILIQYTPEEEEVTSDDAGIDPEDMLYAEEHKDKPWYLEGGDKNE